MSSNFSNPSLAPNVKTSLTPGSKYNLIINQSGVILQYKPRNSDIVYGLPTDPFSHFTVDGSKVDWIKQVGGYGGEVSYNLDVLISTTVSAYQAGFYGPNKVDKSQSYDNSVAGGSSGSCWSYTVPSSGRQAVCEFVQLEMSYLSGTVEGPLQLGEEVILTYTPSGGSPIVIAKCIAYQTPNVSLLLPQIMLNGGDKLETSYNAADTSYGAQVRAYAKIDEVDN